MTQKKKHGAFRFQPCPTHLIQVALHERRPGEPLEARQRRAGPHAPTGAAAAAAAAGAGAAVLSAAVLGAGETEPEPKPTRRWGPGLVDLQSFAILVGGDWNMFDFSIYWE